MSEPWQQTKVEFVGDATGDERLIRISAHAMHVKRAVLRGENVSDDVLAPYMNNTWAKKAHDSPEERRRFADKWFGNTQG